MTIKASSAWPVNELGELVLSPGSGSTNVTNYLSQDFLPFDDSTLKIPAVGLASPTPQLTRVQIATAKAIAGQAGTNFAFFGDSLWVGAGSGTGGKGLINARPLGPVAFLVKQLIQLGIPAANDSFFGEMLLQAYNSTNYDAYDTRFTVSAGASFYPLGTYQSLGGIPWLLNSAGKALNFTPSNAVDTVDIYVLNRSVGTFDCTFAGGASLGTTTSTGAQTVTKITKTFTRGSGAFSISWVSGNAVILGAVFTDSTTPRVNILNLSSYGDRLIAPNGNVYNSTIPEARGGALIPLLGVSGTLVEMTTNSQTIDGIAGIPAFGAALRLMCDYVVAANSDLIIMTPHRIALTDATEATQAAYATEQFKVAQEYKVPVADFSKKISSYATYSTVFFDSKHLAASGAAMRGVFIAPLIAQR